jgi:hypothetical protein
MTQTTKTQIAEVTRIHKIIAPWLPVNPERRLWTITLTGGTKITVCCPLGAAVEVEEAGHHIRAIG